MKGIGIIVCTILCLLLTADGATLPADSSFNSFLARFISDEPFRMERIQYPLKARLGNKAIVKVKTEQWSGNQLKEKLPPLLSKQELVKQGLKQSLRRRSPARIEIFQYRPEADSYLLTYGFEKIRGRWLLTFFEDASL